LGVFVLLKVFQMIALLTAIFSMVAAILACIARLRTPYSDGIGGRVEQDFAHSKKKLSFQKKTSRGFPEDFHRAHCN
jgi:hypothetical protein